MCVNDRIPKPADPVRLTRRTIAKGLLISGAATGLARSVSTGMAHAANYSTSPLPGCGLDLSGAALRTVQDWDRVYTRHWGPLGRQTRAQIQTIVHAVNGVYDDRGGVFAWIVHYWIRAWVVMADLTGRSKYMDMCVSFIDYMLDHTDEQRIARGEIRENYVQEPLYLKGTGKGGPFWSRNWDAGVLTTGQIVRGIMTFVDAIYEKPERWRAYRPAADRYFEACISAADAYDNDWQKFGNKGSYHYRSSDGSGDLGITRTAFNQSATMVTAQLLINKWRPDPTRADKVRRLAQYWIDEYVIPHSDGTLAWRYALIPGFDELEDAGHATIDLDFLVAAYLSGLTNLTRTDMKALARTFRRRLYNDKSGLNRFVDGMNDGPYTDNFNAGFGWLELARFDSEIAPMALKIYNADYPQSAPAGQMWAQPMLGWANLLRAAIPCRH